MGFNSGLKGLINGEGGERAGPRAGFEQQVANYDVFGPSF